MPTRLKRAYGRVRPRVKRRVRRGRTTQKVSPYQGNFGVPHRKRVKMTYVESAAILCTTGVLQKYQFRANGMHDPNLTSGGHQPYGWDQMKALYGNYRVHGCKATAKFYNRGTHVANLVVGLEVSKSAILPFTDYLGFAEKNKGSRQATLLYNSRERASLAVTARTKDIFQVKDVEDEPNLQAATTADPTDQWHVAVWAQAQDLASTEGCWFTIQLDYDVEFFDPFQVDTS